MRSKHPLVWLSYHVFVLFFRPCGYVFFNYYLQDMTGGWSEGGVHPKSVGKGFKVRQQGDQLELAGDEERGASHCQFPRVTCHAFRFWQVN